MIHNLWQNPSNVEADGSYQILKQMMQLITLGGKKTYYISV